MLKIESYRCSFYILDFLLPLSICLNLRIDCDNIPIAMVSILITSEPGEEKRFGNVSQLTVLESKISVNSLCSLLIINGLQAGAVGKQTSF